MTIDDGHNRYPTIDHFVPKSGDHGIPDWTFESANLLVACASCNMGSKGQSNTLSRPHTTDYSRNTFTVFHPYFDDPSLHIIGGYPGGTVRPSPIRGVSSAGLEYIRLFNLSHPSLQHVWKNECYIARREARRKPLRSIFGPALGQMLRELARARRF
ncbi:hypothetical protein ES689_10690 [Frigoribacterium sp. ACAM 257]|uniref:hypothetical protein n=1 Tax=Frigoribacterium sp. ACAM 257 TaxID=2508998 RepID=UPI0011B9FEF8|nr:hypothetical protein [Frigoribacterium sp. ACAM 257]TWX37140.1 hypothetical protein ES689_10690 [Frigoribacterium sp. ACAM 257]